MQMNKLRGKSGQTALETMFVMMFIIIAIGGIFTQTIDYGVIIQKTSEARAVAQGVAMELSVNGTYTHLVRVDYNGSVSGNISVNLYMVSENCNTAQSLMSSRLDSVLGAGSINQWNCTGNLYDDRKYY